MTMQTTTGDTAITLDVWGWADEDPRPECINCGAQCPRKRTHCAECEDEGRRAQQREQHRAARREGRRSVAEEEAYLRRGDHYRRKVNARYAAATAGPDPKARAAAARAQWTGYWR